MTPVFTNSQSRDRSFERLYRAHVEDVYRYALLALRNPADAEDVAQTTFLKAYRAIRRGERPRHPRQWLTTIAHNVCRTRLRDASRRPREVALGDNLVAARQVPEDSIEPRELVRAMSALTLNQRAALVMRELEGRTYAEIAAVLDVSVSAVETLLFRARRALREQLEGALTCGEAERALSLQLDGRLSRADGGLLRAHLRVCNECAGLARRQRARRAALRSVLPLPLPLSASLASWGGGGAGAGIAAKAAVIVAAGIAAAGTTSSCGCQPATSIVTSSAAIVATTVATASSSAEGIGRLGRPPRQWRKSRPFAPRGRSLLRCDRSRSPCASATPRPGPEGPSPRGGGSRSARR
jgi:RNA polymerase sigma factor (sigma-70 family)